MAIYISQRVRRKLSEKHGVTEEEVTQCFANVEGQYLRDSREQHDSDPATHWFISETNRRRVLKVVFIARAMETPQGRETRVEIKTAYPPDPNEISIYERYGKNC